MTELESFALPVPAGLKRKTRRKYMEVDDILCMNRQDVGLAKFPDYQT